MRVCKYKVVGYSAKTRGGNKVVKLSDFIQIPNIEVAKKLEEESKQEVVKNERGKKIDKVKSKKLKKEKPNKGGSELLKELEAKTAKFIVDFVKKHTGKAITFSLKSKKSIVKKALSLLTESEKEDVVIIKLKRDEV